MIARFENKGVVAHASADEAPTGANPLLADRPAEVPEKFWDAKTGTVNYAAWAKSTSELEAALTKSKQTPATQQQAPTVDPVKVHADAKAALEAKVSALKADAASKPEDVAAAEAALAAHPAAPTAETVVENAGLKMDELSAEYAKDGDLSEASYEKLAKVGIPKEMVDTYIEGQKAIAAQTRAESVKLVGGEDKYVEMVTWAGQNLKADEVAAYNSAVAGDPASRALAIQGLHAKFTQARGSDPTLVNGGTNSPAGNGFRSTQEMTKAMQDPRYNVDPAYTADVIQRVSITTAF